MRFIRCGFTPRDRHCRRPTPVKFILHTPRPPRLACGYFFYDRDPRRHPATCGLKARQLDFLSMSFAEQNQVGGPKSHDDIIERVLLRPVSGALVVHPPGRATESVPP